ncbi:hypothetical protein K1F50_09670 [Muricauda oceani]|uniref:Uncharacterized protein n=1 Tax=Flagellimonas oceani TaxID=2698672 RepID=A0A6G7J6S6_9FLAO|nr:hypothetical protein [Allomuricauda oceani]MBW8243066.1 hypothetical protein [Allomuricauda oceani]QII46581.1 hypothetical protein GVT53_18465 [Allomuricauda oceani]
MFESDDEMDANSDEFEKMPIYKKGWVIFDLADKIASLANDEEEYASLPETELGLLQHHAEQLRNDAMLICPKIAGAEGGDLYAIRMENATIIRKAGREIQTGCSGLEMWGFKHTEYLELLRQEIEEFRILFAEWVQTFDPWNYTLDRWGLFNPPGVNFDDPDL